MKERMGFAVLLGLTGLVVGCSSPPKNMTPAQILMEARAYSPDDRVDASIRMAHSYDPKLYFEALTDAMNDESNDVRLTTIRVIPDTHDKRFIAKLQQDLYVCPIGDKEAVQKALEEMRAQK